MPGAFGVADPDVLLAAAQADGGTDGRDLASVVTTPAAYTVGRADAPYFVVAYDFGIKRSILDQLVAADCQVEVVPASTSAADVLAREPDGVFLSNGPGDPAAGRRRAGEHSRAARGSPGCSGSASATRSWASRSALVPSSSNSVITGGTIPSATSRPATSRSRARTTTTPVTPTHCPTARPSVTSI
jgi:hypothetical protein